LVGVLDVEPDKLFDLAVRLFTGKLTEGLSELKADGRVDRLRRNFGQSHSLKSLINAFGNALGRIGQSVVEVEDYALNAVIHPHDCNGRRMVKKLKYGSLGSTLYFSRGVQILDATENAKVRESVLPRSTACHGPFSLLRCNDALALI
jgi:hypothetical protein